MEQTRVFRRHERAKANLAREEERPTMKLVRYPALIVMLAGLAAGCGYGVGTAMFRPPYPPTETVDVYRATLPDRPYAEIAQLRTVDRGNALARLVEQAKAVGADGIIILGRRYRGTDAMAFATGFDVRPFYEIEVVAIRYLDGGK
jgi:hypothetical protein